MEETYSMGIIPTIVALLFLTTVVVWIMYRDKRKNTKDPIITQVLTKSPINHTLLSIEI